MEESIKAFPEQFRFAPDIWHGDKLGGNYQKFVLAGMGGSHLAGGLINLFWPEIDLWIHRDYGLPNIPPEEKGQTLIIVSSYSGNTEETLDCLKLALANGYNVGVISTGGKLLDIAREQQLPHIVLPASNIQPRMALGYSLISVLKFIGASDRMAALSGLAGLLYPLNYEEAGQDLAKKMSGKIPLIYTSARNKPLGYIWKIKLNETGKIPAFHNAFPELNHNELEGFDFLREQPELADKFFVIVLSDEADHERIEKRTGVTRKILEARGIESEVINLKGENSQLKIFANIILADWVAYHTARNLGVDPESVPLIEEFKKAI